MHCEESMMKIKDTVSSPPSLLRGKNQKSTGMLAISFVFYQCFLQQQAWAKSSIDKSHSQEADEAVQANSELDSTNDISNTLSDTEISQLIANMESSTVNIESNDIHSVTDLLTRDDAVANLFDHHPWSTHHGSLQSESHSSFQEGSASDLQAINESEDTLLEFNTENDMQNAGVFIEAVAPATTTTTTTVAASAAGAASVTATATSLGWAGGLAAAAAAVATLVTAISTAKGKPGEGSTDTLYVSDLSGDLLMLEERDVAENYHVTSKGGIAQNGAQIVKGDSTFIANADDKTITLENAFNALTGAVTLTTQGAACVADASLNNGATALIMDASTVKGNLTLTTGNDITDRGIVDVCKNLVVTTTAANGAIDMDTLAVDGTIAVTTDGTGDATLVNDAALTFAASSVGGALDATATTGDLTQNGALTVTGTSAFTTANNASITLAHANNAFANAVTLKAGDGTNNFTDVSFRDSGGIKIEASSAANDENGDLFLDTIGSDNTVGGNLSLTAESGNINQAGALTVTGTSTFIASQTNTDIVLEAANNFGGAVSVTASGDAGDALITDADTLLFGTINIGGSLTGKATQGSITAGTIGLGTRETLVLQSTDGTAANRVYTITDLQIDNGASDHTIGTSTHKAKTVTITEIREDSDASVTSTLKIWHQGNNNQGNSTAPGITIGNGTATWNTADDIEAYVSVTIDHTNVDFWVITL